jgi:hypothetical protein
MKKLIHKVWTFQSDSNPDVSYQTLQYTDGTSSCECRGWCRRVAADGSRSCKHTRWVDQGIAYRYSTATHDYRRSLLKKPFAQLMPDPVRNAKDAVQSTSILPTASGRH